jgi:hypothetical protein
MNIDGYFALYLKNRITYNRSQHMINMGILNTKHITPNVIRKIFVYIDTVLFNATLSKYVNELGLKILIKVSKALTSSAGMFFLKSYKTKIVKIGFKISYKIFQNMINKNTINLDLGVIDQTGKRYISSNPIEPLVVTLEHEMIHMMMFATRHNKLNDLLSVKSGHTKGFKTLVYNIFGHNNIKHRFGHGDAIKKQEISDSLNLGDKVSSLDNKITGYIVSKRPDYCIIYNDSATNTIKPYTAKLYNDLKKLEGSIDVKTKLLQLKPNVKVIFNKMQMIITNVTKTNIIAIDTNGNKQKIQLHNIMQIEKINS